jgi:hypothetical protein
MDFPVSYKRAVGADLVREHLFTPGIADEVRSYRVFIVCRHVFHA